MNIDKPIVKECTTCGRIFKDDKDVLTFGKRWRICSSGHLWFNCSCQSTMMIPKGKFDWYSPAHRMSDEAHSIFNTIPELKAIPHISTAVMELQELLADENVFSARLASAVKKDPITAGNILKFANGLRKSGRSVPIKSLDHAISFIGIKSMQDIVLAASIQGFTLKCTAFKPEEHWEEALLCGRIAEAIASEFAKDSLVPDEAYIAGCLCNVGKIVMSICFPEQADKVYLDTKNVHHPMAWHKSELRHSLPAGHAILGEVGAAFWGLPDYVLDTASHHHVVPDLTNSSITVLDVVGLANQISHWLALEPGKIDAETLRVYAAKFRLNSQHEVERYVEKLTALRAA